MSNSDYNVFPLLACHDAVQLLYGPTAVVYVMAAFSGTGSNSLAGDEAYKSGTCQRCFQ